jgi:hypothetical protein
MNETHGVDGTVISYGWPRVKFPIDESALSGFRKRVDKSSHPKGCWVWKGRIHMKGYGIANYGQRSGGAHRMSWVIHNQKLIPEGMCICHSCDNPPCVNPDHLWIGTNQENRDDSVKKGRQAKGDRSGMRVHPESRSRGENHGNSKFTYEDIWDMRRLYSEGAPAKTIGVLYETRKTHVLRIVNRQRWTHV